MKGEALRAFQHTARAGVRVTGEPMRDDPRFKALMADAEKRFGSGAAG